LFRRSVVAREPVPKNNLNMFSFDSRIPAQVLSAAWYAGYAWGSRRTPTMTKNQMRRLGRLERLERIRPAWRSKLRLCARKLTPRESFLRKRSKAAQDRSHLVEIGPKSLNGARSEPVKGSSGDAKTNPGRCTAARLAWNNGFHSGAPAPEKWPKPGEPRHFRRRWSFIFRI
jgi:hypothetical protein